ncbi:hypothetical protein, partial [Clostridium beijerinckii]|uniref:hypothetical protein n=3 Tax=Clostridium TaxID=1485 RepID=UPI0019D11F6C
IRTFYLKRAAMLHIRTFYLKRAAMLHIRTFYLKRAAMLNIRTFHGNFRLVIYSHVPKYLKRELE